MLTLYTTKKFQSWPCQKRHKHTQSARPLRGRQSHKRLFLVKIEEDQPWQIRELTKAHRNAF